MVPGRTYDTSLDKGSGIRPGLESRQSRDLPVDSKKLEQQCHTFAVWMSVVTGLVLGKIELVRVQLL